MHSLWAPQGIGVQPWRRHASQHVRAPHSMHQRAPAAVSAWRSPASRSGRGDGGGTAQPLPLPCGLPGAAAAGVALAAFALQGALWAMAPPAAAAAAHARASGLQRAEALVRAASGPARLPLASATIGGVQPGMAEELKYRTLKVRMVAAWRRAGGRMATAWRLHDGRKAPVAVPCIARPCHAAARTVSTQRCGSRHAAYAWGSRAMRLL